MKKPKAKYIQFSEETNALDYLTKACNFIQNVETNPKDWKWIIISLHGCLYGFAICAVQGTNYETVTYKTKKGETRLISFDQAIEACQDKNRMTWTTASQPLVLTPEQKESIRWLSKEYRNNFEHYTPRSWYIETHGLPAMAINVLNVIRFLALDTGNYIHLNITQQKQIKSLVYQAKRTLSKSKLYKESVLAHKLHKEKHKIIK